MTGDFRLIAGVRLTGEEKSRDDRVWMLTRGFPGGGEEPVRYGAGRFRYEGLGRSLYTPPDDYDSLSAREQAGARVEAYLARGASAPATECRSSSARIHPPPSPASLRTRAGVE